MKKIRLIRPYTDNEELEAIKIILDSGNLAQGPEVKRFEEEFSKELDVKYSSAVNSCTSALHLALLALDLKPNDEIIIPNFTFPATGNVPLIRQKTSQCAQEMLTALIVSRHRKHKL